MKLGPDSQCSSNGHGYTPGSKSYKLFPSWYPFLFGCLTGGLSKSEWEFS